jgi:hypothetical protein
MVSDAQLAASLVASLAWPVFILGAIVAAWIKRREIIDLVGSNGAIAEGRKLKRLKAGPIELEWEALIASTAEQVNRAMRVTSTRTEGTEARPSERPVIADRNDTGAGGTGISPDAILPISSSVPTAAILEEFARIESRLRYILSRAGKHPSPRDTAVALSERALEAGLITPELSNAIKGLAGLRNEAAHRVGQADISTEQARQYLDLAERVLTGLGASTGISTSSSIDSTIWP